MKQHLTPYPHVLHFSSDDLPEKDRLPYWREFFGRGIVGLELQPLANQPFHASAILTRLPDLYLMSGSLPAINQRRIRSLLCDGNDDLIWSVNLSGKSVTAQHGREHILNQGDMTLLSAAEVGTNDFVQAARYSRGRMSVRKLKAMVPDIEDWIGERTPRDTPALRLLTDYLDTWQRGQFVTLPDMQQALSDHVYDLVALVFNAKGNAAEQAMQRGGRAAQLVMIRREIERGFIDPDFSLLQLALRTHTHTRHVQRVLEQAGSSFVREVTERRLKLAHDMLRSPRHQHQSITEIANTCGFSTAAHFYRQFHRFFDATPRQAREMKDIE
jgi:AraC-like DNA-binding protein